MRYFSMFTGVGGFELGIGKRWECVGFSETDKYASELLKRKFPNIKNYGDATKINPKELPDFDMLCGGFPCQAFSIAGKRKGFNETRGTLFFDIYRIAKHKQPRYLFLENVKGLLSHDNGRTFAIILSKLDELGYDVEWQVCNSKFFGVPQNRERVFIIGHFRGESRPKIFPFKNKQPQSNGGVSKKKRIISPTISTKQDRGVPLMVHCGVLRKGEWGDGTKEDESFTLESNSGRDLLIDNIRHLTPIECERLQGFPDNWTQGFSHNQRYKMMGNAVTVNVIEAIVRRFEQLKQR